MSRWFEGWKARSVRGRTARGCVETVETVEESLLSSALRLQTRAVYAAGGLLPGLPEGFVDFCNSRRGML